MIEWPPSSLENTMKTKREILAWAALNGIELMQDKSGSRHHITIYAPTGKWFGYGMHSWCLWDDRKKPNWPWIGKDLLSGIGDLEPCPLDDCEVCND